MSITTMRYGTYRVNKKYVRKHARSLTDKEIAYDTRHCRKLMECFFRGQWDVYYCILMGIYRAEMARRNPVSESKTHTFKTANQ